MIPAEILKQIKPGATVRVFETARDKDKARMSQFEGLVISRKHGSEPGASFTVRQVIAGLGVEKVYPVHTPVIAKVQIISSPKKVSRSKLYYLRDRSRKEVRQHTQIASQKTAA